MSQKKQKEFMALYKPVHAKFERFCRARAYGEMEPKDLLNDSLLVAFEKWDDIKNKEAIFSFLCGTAIRVMANYSRKKRPHRDLDGISMMQPSDDKTDRLVEINILHEALAKLPIEQKDCLILFEISGFSIKEIAELQKVGESAVKQRLRRGRIQLRIILSEKETKPLIQSRS